MPAFELLPERNTRRGFLSEEDHDKLRASCAQEGLWLVAFLEIACTYAWRASEVLNLRIRNIDLFGGGRGTIRLDANTTKNKQGRVVPLTDGVRTIIGGLMLGKKADDYLLTRENGKRVSEPRGAWRRACVRAGLAEFRCHTCDIAVGEKRTCPECGRKWKFGKARYVGLLAHDLRRSGARNLLRAGVPEVTAMAIGGWQTNQTFKRYAIVSENDLARALDKLEVMKKAERELAALEAAQNSARENDVASSLQVAVPKLPS
jgi:integrase